METAETRKTSRTALLAIAVCVLSFRAKAQYGGGTGEPNDPYLIYTAEQMNAIGLHEQDWSKNFKLMADIDLRNYAGTEFNAIGYSTWDDQRPFTGVFEGSGYTILGFCYACTDQELVTVGLFGHVEGPFAQIRNLELIAPQVDAGEAGAVGSLVGLLQAGVVTGCYVEGGTVNGCRFVGGLVGLNYGDMVNCSSSAAVSGAECAWAIGGLVGSNSGTMTACRSAGTVSGDYDIGGLVGENRGYVGHCLSTAAVDGNEFVGGLVGENQPRGHVIRCYSAGTVRGFEDVGGLAGVNSDTVSDCYAACAVGGKRRVGGLVGRNGCFTESPSASERPKSGTIFHSYSVGSVTGTDAVGGLVGSNTGAQIHACFWDTETSSRSASAGGIGKATVQMRTAETFLAAGWDFVDETENGTEDIWCILEGQDYPKLVRPLSGFSPNPQDDATDVMLPLVLSWGPGESAVYHDVYFGDDEEAVTNGTTENPGVYRGRHLAETTTYNPGMLEYARTYYWRIDEVNDLHPDSPWIGKLWSFTTADFIVVLVVDDFERYTDDLCADCYAPFQIWVDGYENGTGSRVGYLESFNGTFGETVVVHGGWQSMPLFYDNDGTVHNGRPSDNGEAPFYSECVRTWRMPQDWTIDDADTLTLYFRGEPDNGPDRLYVAIEDRAGRVAVASHPDAEAVRAAEWRKWHVSLADLQAASVDVASVKKMMMGVGDRNDPRAGGAGVVYIDDIMVTNRMP